MGLSYFDASILIDGTDPDSRLFSTISAAIRTLTPAERAVGEMVRLECLVRLTRIQDHVRIAELESFFSGLVNLPLDRAVCDLAIDLRARHQGLKTPDALHLATALHHDARSSGRTTAT